MKKLLITLAIFSLPTLVAAGTKDVQVTNEVGVKVMSLPANALDLALDYVQLDLFCSVNSTSGSCTSNINPDPSVDKLTHWATISILADPGHTCIGTLYIVDQHDSGGAQRPLMSVWATEFTPGVASMTEIRIPFSSATSIARKVDVVASRQAAFSSSSPKAQQGATT